MKPVFSVSIAQTTFITGQKIEIVVVFDSLPKQGILFVDLVSSENTWISGAKYEVLTPVSSFDFLLSDELVSGIYLLRIYEDFNKCKNPEVKRIAIKVVNPYNPKTLGFTPLNKPPKPQKKPENNFRLELTKNIDEIPLDYF